MVTLSRSRLTHRLVMFLALASAKRVSDLFLFCVDDQHLRILSTKWTFLTAFGAKQERQTHSVPPITFNQNVESSRLCPVAHLVEYMSVDDQHLRILSTKWTFLTAFGAKQERQTHSVPPITFNQNVESSRLCPVAHLVEYMRRTRVERLKDTSHKLFRTTVHPFRPAAKSTIAKWLVLVLSDAGMVDSAGSTRAAAATWSVAKGVRTTVIMAAADWSSVRTMRKHYLRLLPKDALLVKPSVQDATLAFDKDD